MTDIATENQKLVEFDTSVVKLRIGQAVKTTARERRYCKVACAEFGGRHEYRGPVSQEPWAFLVGCGVMITADGQGMAEWNDAVTLDHGDRVFVEHYGWHLVEVCKRGFIKLIRERDLVGTSD